MVIGASRGIGAAIVRRLDADGLSVTAVARDADGLAATVSGCRAASTLTADVTTPEGRAELVEHGAGDRQPHVVVSVVHARRPWSTIARTDPSAYAAAVEDHLAHLAALAAVALPAQRAAGFGRWVFVSTLTASLGGHGQAVYVAHKAALEGFARTLAIEEGRRGITSNVVIPGFIETENTLTRYTDEQRAAFADASVVQRAGSPDEVAHAVSFLVDERAGFVTGASIPVTGGAELGWWLGRAAAATPAPDATPATTITTGGTSTDAS